ncbi:aminotransferase DegT [Clostridium beijerinckii]|uniref:Aminotransferase DegT n=1 Tax=Clostridium beijerinckii TaxID=1520 RepID=A0A0B5QN85_CLOBE|nr:DegT/DnrJ/EryC1/StrS family aminotransferase [Clostridium beijerinckii]AJG99487.1 aminotransferase DegT [Clostridium beijerinckii]
MINVTKAYLPDITSYKNYIDKIFNSGWLTNNGQFVQKLEKRLQEYLNVKNLILVSNGTIALQLAYRALELSEEVITTPFTFAATVSSQVWEGLRPIFADINSETFCIDYKQIENSITKKSKAIVPVHVFGNACDIDEIQKIANKNNLKVIYDAAHAFGVKYKNKSILSYGDISTISFHSTKLFHTIEGGAIVVNDDELYDKLKLMINFGIRGPEKIEGLGINAKMNEFQAAMGLCVLEDIDKILEGRKRVHNFYMDNLSKELQLQKYNEYCTRNYAYFPVVFKTDEVLMNIIKELNENDIFPRRYFYPSLDTLNYLKNSKYMPISNNVSNKILCLPIYDSLEEEKLKQIVAIINRNL